MKVDRKLSYNDRIKEAIKKVNHKIWMLETTRKYPTANKAIEIHTDMIDAIRL